jgi:hypothetical protein
MRIVPYLAEDSVADTAAAEVGHGAGLRHDGVLDGRQRVSRGVGRHDAGTDRKVSPRHG